MRGIRGLKRCLCDANRVFGWSARPKPLYDEFGGLRSTSFLHEAYGVIMPAVNAPYTVARGGVPVGGTPKPDPNFALPLPVNDPRSGYDLGGDESLLSEVHGARCVYDDDGTPWVVYVIGKKYDLESNGSSEDWGDGNPSFPCAFVASNVRTGESITRWLPKFARLNLPQDTGANWASLFLYGAESLPGGGYVWHPPCIGFSRDTIVICDQNRILDGTGNVMRYRFSDDTWSVGYGESATTDGRVYICMPAQMSGDGQPWVLAKEYNTYQMFTGKWTNTLAYHGGHEPAIGSGPIADLPARLTASEAVNRLDNKPGWTANLDWFANAYTRRNGYDYLIVTPRNEMGWMTPRYYDGRRGHWYDATDYRNIYAFDNGDVVLASPLKVKYINADRSTRWEWVAPQYPDFGPSARGYETPFLSGNDSCIQIKNVSLVDKVTPPTYHDMDLVRQASTAPLDTRKFTSHTGPTFCEVAISLSREGNPQPTCVIHRSLDRNTWDEEANQPATKKNYQTNFYATNETLDAEFQHDPPRIQSHRAFEARQVGGMSFDCAPSCQCNCAISAQLAY